MSDPQRTLTLLGCPFDNGIRSMLRYGRGVTGAADGPEAVIDALRTQHPKTTQELDIQLLDLKRTNLPLHHDLGNASFVGQQLESTLQAHATIERAVNEIVQAGQMPIGVGGDHSVTYPLARGVMTSSTHNRWGLVYVDAHLDLRAWGPEDGEDIISSGNSFWRLLEDPDVPLSGETVVALGIQPSDTNAYRQLARRATDYGMTAVDRATIADRGINPILDDALTMVGQGTDAIYLSLDMDALDRSVAPGVSAPNQNGLTRDELLKLIDGLAHDERVVGFDVVETSSREQAWFEVLKGRSRSETRAECSEALSQTAQLAAEAIARFLQRKTEVASRDHATRPPT